MILQSFLPQVNNMMTWETGDPICDVMRRLKSLKRRLWERNCRYGGNPQLRGSIDASPTQILHWLQASLPA